MHENYLTPEITHNQARRYLMSAADGLLGEGEKSALQRHLRACEMCSVEADRLNALQRGLRSTFHARWDAVTPPENLLVTSLPAVEPLLPRLARVGVNLLLLALWAWLYWAVFAYLRIIFSREEFRTNQLVLIGVVVLIFIQFRQRRLRPRLDALPQIHAPGLALALGGSVLYLVAERFLDINTLSATLFGLATYGLLGLWMSPRRWQEGLPAAMLLIGTLPFGDHLQTFVGYPMRLATANIVRNGLQVVGIHSVGVDTILVLESGLAQVDLPCSGVKSLWTGMLFLTAAAWIERRAINLRWLVTVALTALLLFVANVARVAILVVVGQVAGWMLGMELIHVPLGVLAFVGVCAAALLLIRWQKPVKLPPSMAKEGRAEQNGASPAGVKRPAWLAPLLAVVFTAMALLYTPRPQPAAAQAAVNWVFPPELQATVYSMSPELRDWATQDGADFADRWFFTWQEGERSVSGSMLFVTSSTWRAQHAPERCFEVEGLAVDNTQTVLFDDDFPARLVLLHGGSIQVSALYWLQTGNRATDDFATRIWADLAPERQRWVLVTVLLDDVYAADNIALRTLAQTVRSAVAHSLEGGLP